MNRKFTLFLYFFIFLIIAKVLEALVISLINNVSFSLDISLQSIIITTIISIGAAVLVDMQERSKRNSNDKAG